MASPRDGRRPPPGGVVPATAALAADMAARLSRDHAREVWDTAGLSPMAAVLASLESSVEAYAYRPAGSGPAAFLMGVESAGSLTASAMIWMLAAELAPGRAAGVVRAARWGLARAFAVTGAVLLEQYIPEWYGTGVRFAERMGFVAAPSALRTKSGARLWRVVLRRPGMDMETF